MSARTRNPLQRIGHVLNRARSQAQQAADDLGQRTQTLAQAVQKGAQSFQSSLRHGADPIERAVDDRIRRMDSLLQLLERYQTDHTAQIQQGTAALRALNASDENTLSHHEVSRLQSDHRLAASNAALISTTIDQTEDHIRGNHLPPLETPSLDAFQQRAASLEAEQRILSERQAQAAITFVQTEAARDRFPNNPAAQQAHQAAQAELDLITRAVTQIHGELEQNAVERRTFELGQQQDDLTTALQRAEKELATAAFYLDNRTDNVEQRRLDHERSQELVGIIKNPDALSAAFENQEFQAKHPELKRLKHLHETLETSSQTLDAAKTLAAAARSGQNTGIDSATADKLVRQTQRTFDEAHHQLSRAMLGIFDQAERLERQHQQSLEGLKGAEQRLLDATTAQSQVAAQLEQIQTELASLAAPRQPIAELTLDQDEAIEASA